MEFGIQAAAEPLRFSPGETSKVCGIAAERNRIEFTKWSARPHIHSFDGPTRVSVAGEYKAVSEQCRREVVHIGVDWQTGNHIRAAAFGEQEFLLIAALREEFSPLVVGAVEGILGKPGLRFLAFPIHLQHHCIIQLVDRITLRIFYYLGIPLCCLFGIIGEAVAVGEFRHHFRVVGVVGKDLLIQYNSRLIVKRLHGLVCLVAEDGLRGECRAEGKGKYKSNQFLYHLFIDRPGRNYDFVQATPSFPSFT